MNMKKEVIVLSLGGSLIIPDNVDLTQVVELVDNTDLSGEIACGAAGCEVK